MRPAARLQSAIELLDAIIIAAKEGGASADQLAKLFFAERRYAGSKDRRAVRELAWQAIRRFGERPESARSAFVALADEDAALVELFDGSDYGPPMIGADEPRAKGGPLPIWILPHLSSLIEEHERSALLDRAPLDLRVNALKTSREDVADQLPDAELLSQTSEALRLPTGYQVESLPLLIDGFVEIQDLGSQLIVDACAARSGMTVLDLCAGAGGKTLALAAAMKNEGKLIASDTNRNRLDQLKPRANRAGATMVETRLLNPGREIEMLSDLAGSCEIVLIDAPCSGSGTWRRNPETRWRLDPVRLERVLAEQAKLLQIGAEMVASGGHLVYAVCSIIANEGRGQVARFLDAHQGWQAVDPDLGVGRKEGDGIILTPHHDGSDGFFFARLLKL
ncbi:RsmB/NOP family class I SAM-dependent RNA methyltransferase [Sphingorhabdus sp.]|uniref:RsmB/NOP family class I SAM-dependent RNA methyltransferase n=1 Tax=Sphingorhabdus sp. TaxID=1902408 RepID=UPI003593B7C2